MASSALEHTEPQHEAFLVVTRAELIELSDLNFWEATRELSRRAGGTVLDERGLLLFAGGHPLPVLANGVFRTTTAVGAPDVLARARRFFAQQQRGFTVFVRAHSSSPTLPCDVP